MLRFIMSSFVAGVLVFNSAVYSQQPAVPAPAAEHDHEEHGPHEGELLEVGQEEYHIEVVMDEDKKQMMVYLLDKAVKSYVAIDTPFLAVNLKVAGKPAQIKLKPVPQDVDQKGYSSCFGIASPELIDALHDPKSEAKLALKIANKPYVVKLLHDHDHAGHDHEGHDHAGHDHPAPKKK